MRSFILRHKKISVALLSTAVTLTLTYCASFTMLRYMLRWISQWTGRLDLVVVSLGLFCIFIGKELGEKTSEKFFLVIISIAFSFATFWMFWIIMFSQALGDL